MLLTGFLEADTLLTLDLIVKMIMPMLNKKTEQRYDNYLAITTWIIRYWLN